MRVDCAQVPRSAGRIRLSSPLTANSSVVVDRRQFDSIRVVKGGEEREVQVGLSPIESNRIEFVLFGAFVDSSQMGKRQVQEENHHEDHRR